jgi:hypothetical protein
MSRLNLQEAAAEARVETEPERFQTGSEAARPAASGSSEILGGILLLAVLVIWLAARWLNVTAPPECRMDPSSLLFGVDEQAFMTVPANAPCAIWPRATSRVDDFKITAPPENGIAAPRARSGVVYRPNPNFRGEDAFSFSLRGKSGRFDGESVIRVQVLVK